MQKEIMQNLENAANRINIIFKKNERLLPPPPNFAIVKVSL